MPDDHYEMASDHIVVMVPERTRTEYVTQTVHHHNAPAADQARLLHDLRAEAERQLLSVTRLDGNRLTGTAHVILLPPGITTRVILRMNVNDEVLEVRVGYDHATTSAAVLGDMLVRQMSEALAARFLYQMLRGVTLPTSEHEVSRTA